MQSSSVGTIFSMLASTICTRGRVCVRSPLPSLVTMTLLPVSAIRKLAPVMPTSAARNRSPQLGACLGQDVAAFVEHAVRRQVGVRLAEARLPVLLVEVERRRDDVAGQLVTKLDDVFAEIGLDRRDAVAFQVVVDAQLLADHRLALGDGAGVGRAADRQHRLARFIRGGAPVHLAAGGQQLRFAFLEVEIEIRQRVVLDVARGVAQLLELRQRGDRGGAAGDEAGAAACQRLLQPGIGDGAMGVLLEGRRGGDVHADPVLSRDAV